jgi:hypothetical protein
VKKNKHVKLFNELIENKNLTTKNLQKILTQVYSIKHEFDKKIEKLEASTNQWDDFYGTFISSELFQEIVRKSEEKKPAKKTKKQNSNG